MFNVINMHEFIVQHILYNQFLTGNEFMDLTNTCKQLRQFNTTDCLKHLWKHGRVKNLRTALYVEHKLNKYNPKDIYNEAFNRTKQLEVLSALKSLNIRVRKPVSVQFLLGKKDRLRSILGKRNTLSI